ncbi:chromate resistance protein ChrB domain-containing protein [Pedobacter puniceum]|uniref:Helix-turn-helix domain-containing protein n=1 Tax=Pedobacter puniceum TaxID=2666136 RepID=A0A7K0FR14_9SPHI|nr:chromate resistance protein ChrB domain-containing protein [Pedobacter puniceum]MRX48439.1 helix-turn-helix domain-containing protein [Pedobacter puniceum]
MKWITRKRPKIDRIACPWLIKRFIDADAEIIYVAAQDVIRKAQELGAIPFDVPHVEFTHYQDKCTFDYFIEKYKLEDEALTTLSLIVRGADTDAHHLAPQASGLWAISAGLAYNYKDDNELLEIGLIIYDALYSWAKHLKHVKHTQNSTDSLFLDVYHKYLKHQKEQGKKTPSWAKELKEIIQDQIDINMNVSLKDVSEELKVNPAYISREFAKHFDNLSFGDYIRKLRIEKAISLIESTDYKLSEIAFLTGFSDQSHFTRIFKKIYDLSPAQYKKALKSKIHPKGKISSK